MTSAIDIVRAGQPPRAVFIDYPLGHTTGRLHDTENQLALVTEALQTFDRLTEPGRIVTLPHTWQDVDWKAREGRADRGDVRSARDNSPQWQFDDDRIQAELAAKRETKPK